MILPDRDIMKLCLDGYLKRPLIEPFDRTRVQPASYDLSLGNEFVTFNAHHQVCVDLAFPADMGEKIVIPDDEPFILHPGQFALGVTAERINLPATIAGKLDGKSSLARLGLLIHVTGGFIDPGFSGPLTLEILNVFPVPILLRPGLPVCQIGFTEMRSAAENPYQGRYQNAEGVEASKYSG